MKYKKILGLDLGSKSLGIALSDNLNIIAQGCENYFYKDNDLKYCLNKVNEYIHKYNLDQIVLGYPLYPSGDKSESTYLVEKFKLLLETEFKIEVILEDESYSTVNAKNFMIAGNVSRKKRKSKKDMVAAEIILQQFLNKLK